MDLGLFAKICGLLSSSHPGERAAAALKATEMLREAGLTWEELIIGKQGRTKQDKNLERRPHANLAQKLLDDHLPSFNEKTAEFLRDVAWKYAWQDLTERQQDWLEGIARRVFKNQTKKVA